LPPRRRRSENARLLRETKNTKEYLENLIASSVDAIVTLDPLGRITFVSKAGSAHSDAAVAR